MTCTHFASFAQGPVRASWLAEDIPCGPRSRRIGWPSEGRSGLAPITPKNWTHVGSLDIETRQALHELHLLARKEALAATLAKLRREHKATCSVMTDLRNVTLHILSLGERDHGAGNQD